MVSNSDDSDDFMMQDDDFESDCSVVEKVSMPKPSQKSKRKEVLSVNAGNTTTKPKSKSTTTKKLAVATTKASASSSEDAAPAKTKTTAKGKKKTVEETYVKVSQVEHILLRPDTYIGSTQPLTEKMFVLTAEEKIVEREITYTPGLFKIYDEILVNAADNKQRDPEHMSKIEIVIDKDENRISVKNNGKGIPIVMHQKHGIYVPTMIFGQLLTGSNFDDDEKKTTGGRNGYGAKLANVFSTEFIVECVDTENQMKFRQVFKDNMTVAMEPKISKCTASEVKQGDYVKITFSPDLARFKMDRLDEDTVGLLSRRAYDIAGTMGKTGGKALQVSLNGKKLLVKNFASYIALYEGIGSPVAFQADERWEVGIGLSSDGVQQQISFVNAIATSKGGRHVKYIEGMIAEHLLKVLTKKDKKTTIKKSQIANHLTIMINCLIENPSFDSQTKDSLNTQTKAFGSTFECSSSFLKKIEKSEIVDHILSFAMFKDKQALKRKGGTKKKKLTGISKLDDANNAGSAKSKDCTLIITEGDSAKSLAVAGLSVVGRDYYGVFPLKGKPLNVRDSKTSDVIKNEEIKNLVDIMGLNYGTEYDETNIKSLRYGHLVIMADQDTDGSHIKGLIINFIHNFWPSLLDIPGFLQQFITPIVKVTKNKRSKTFFTLHEYKTWLDSTGNNGKGFTIKYYKGLGTSTSAEAKEYFADLGTHLIDFGCINEDQINIEEKDQVLPDSVTSGSDLIDMVFRKDRVEDRKTWLTNIQTGVYLDYKEASTEGVRYSDFFNKEFILFSQYDTHRSIPHLVDGLKPSQRKVLFGCFKRKLTKNEIKVAQLVGYIAEHSSYHHGEASLQSTIVNMAQNFVVSYNPTFYSRLMFCFQGSNNINLLTPSGQFGTRRMGGKDAASARYIFTKLEPIARAIFHPDDDDLLNYLNDDGTSIEPEYYVPVIPMILVNGADGIGTGWSSAVCNFDPRQIVSNIRRKIALEETVPMDPYYYGFIGEIKKEGTGKYTVLGKIERIDDTTLLITELPIKKWTQNYKEFIESMMVGDSKKTMEVKDFRENHTESTVSFTIIADKEMIDDCEKDPKGLSGKFKLQSSLSTSNMTLFDGDGRIKRYDSPEAILDAFYDIRLDFYVKRKENLMRILAAEKLMLSNKARFVEEVCQGTLVVSNRRRKDLLEDLKGRNYDLISNTSKEGRSPDKEEHGTDSLEVSENDDEGNTAELAKGYEYLLGMKIWSLTFEKAEQLRLELANKKKELESLSKKQPSLLWLDDLNVIEAALDARDIAIQGEKDDELRAQTKNTKRVNAGQGKAKKKKVAKKKKEWNSDMEEEYDDDDSFMESNSTKGIQEVEKILQKSAKSNPAIAKKTATKEDPIVLDPDLVDENLFVPLAERMKKTLKIAPSSSLESKKRSSPRSDDTSDDELDFVDLTQSRNTKPPVPKKVARKAKGSGANKKVAAKTILKPKAKAAPKKTHQSSSSDSEIEVGSVSNVSLKQNNDEPKVKRGGRTTASKPLYVFSSDEDASVDDNSDR